MSRGLINELRHQERDSRRRLRELQRLEKEKAKLSALENARLEVETYENHLDILGSVHKEQASIRDWNAIVTALRPVRPERLMLHEFRARQDAQLHDVINAAVQNEQTEAAIKQARQRDEDEFQQMLQTYSADKARWKKMKYLASGILNGDPMAYLEALADLNPLDELRNVGSPPNFTVHDPKLMECVFTVNGTTVIPPETKTLTASGKVSTKSMPRIRFQEIYQGYVCGCVLRIAREIFAFLPVDTVLVTASADVLDPSTGRSRPYPVVSAAILRPVISNLDFDQVEPLAAIESLLHRSGFTRSTKGGEYAKVVPLTPADIPRTSRESLKISSLVSEIKAMREELRTVKTVLFSNRMVSGVPNR